MATSGQCLTRLKSKKFLPTSERRGGPWAEKTAAENTQELPQKISLGTPSTSEIPTNPPPRSNLYSKLLDYTARPRAEQNSTSVQSSKRPQAEEVLLFGATITLITW